MIHQGFLARSHERCVPGNWWFGVHAEMTTFDGNPLTVKKNIFQKLHPRNHHEPPKMIEKRKHEGPLHRVDLLPAVLIDIIHLWKKSLSRFLAPELYTQPPTGHDSTVLTFALEVVGRF